VQHKPGKHPKPPVDFDSKRLPVIAYKNKFYRIFPISNSPVHFGKTGNNRFDAPHNEFGVMYVGCDAYCAFIETAQLISGIDYPAVSFQWIAQKGICIFKTTHELHLVNLTKSEEMIALGADARIWTADYTISQLWSFSFWKHPQHPDGIIYPARHDYLRKSIALYNRAKKKISIENKHKLSNYNELETIVDFYKIGLL